MVKQRRNRRIEKMTTEMRMVVDEMERFDKERKKREEQGEG